MLIGEVAQRSGISARMLRHYDRIGVVSPSGRTAAGYRHYTEDDLRRLFHVEGLRSLGLSLKEVAQALDGADLAPASLVAQLVEQTRERIAREHELLATLGRVQASDPIDWSDVLHTVGLMRRLEAGDPSARQRVALRLAGVEDRDVTVLAEAALQETNPTVAGTLYWALARSADAAVPPLRAALDSADPKRRRRAIEALEKVNTPLALDAISSAQGHDDPLVRRRAAIAGARRGDARAIPELVALVVGGLDGPDATAALQLMAAEAGMAIQVDRAINHAFAAAETDALVRLVDALAEIGGPHSTHSLHALTTHPERRVALAATYALRAGDPTK